MRIRFRLSGHAAISTGLLVCTVIALVLQSCAKKRPGAISPLPGGRAGLADGRAAEPVTDLNTIASGTEELWVLARGETPAGPIDDTPGSWSLLAKIEEKEIPIP
jgi:hypothetical protein